MMDTKMQTVNISDFRANLLKYLEIAGAGEQITVTSNGKFLATIAPPINQKKLAKKQLNSLALTAKVQDVTSPTDNEWEALL
jgi:prevent-host-death family protein